MVVKQQEDKKSFPANELQLDTMKCPNGKQRTTVGLDFEGSFTTYPPNNRGISFFFFFLLNVKVSATQLS